MANATTAFGFRPVKPPDPSSLLTVAALSGYATDLFVGDAVVPVGSGEYLTGTGYMTVARAAAGDTNVVGIIVGFEPMSPDALTSRYGAASTLRLCKIVPAFQSTIFECMMNASADVDSIGNGADIVATAGSTVTGFSGMTCDTTLATTNKSLRILGFANRPDNEFTAASTGIKAYVFFAESLWNNGPGV